MLAVFALDMLMRQWEETAHARSWVYGFVAISAVVVAVALFVVVQSWLPHQEPGPLFDGVSAVPMVTLQITTIYFAVAVVLFAGGRMRHALFHVADRLQKEEPDCGRKAIPAAGQEFCTRVKNAVLSRWGDKRTVVRAVRPWRWDRETVVRAILSWRCPGLVSTWKYEIARFDDKRFKEAADLWSELWRYSRWWWRSMRIAAVFCVGWLLRETYFANVRLEQPLLGQAVTAPGCVEWILPIMVFWAISYCRDTLSMWLAFIRAVGRFDVTGGKIERDSMQSEAAICGRWSMDLLVRCTDLIGPVVVLPLILMVLLLLSRSTIFEGWNWTAPLIVFHVGLAVYILFIAVEFQREASHAREAVLDRLREARLGAEVGEATEIENVMEYIRSRRDGAFVSWTQQPILKALVLPLGAWALIELLEALLGGR